MAEELQKQELTSLNIAENQLQKLKEIFPEAFTEGNKVDWDKLRLTLGENIDTGKERFGMNWPGKADCFKTIQQPSIATLVPDREESINFDTTENLFIEGDNLEVLKLLQKSYLGKVKMIYIDPPYNTGNDFIYPDNYSENLNTYLEYSGQIDGEGRKFSTNTETDGRFHSKWMNMMYPRLFLAKNLLKEDGVIFASIDDSEIDNLKKLCAEIYGEENFIGQLVWKKKYIGGKHAKHFVDLHEYVIVFSKNIEKLGEFFMERPEAELEKFELEDEYLNERGRFYIRPLKSNLGHRATLIYPIEMPDGTILKTQWMVAADTLDKLKKEGRIIFKQKRDGSYNIYRKYYEFDNGGSVKVPSLIDDVSNANGKVEIKELFEIKEGREIPFDNPKPVGLLKHLIRPVLKNDDIILDFFAGSGTTAHAILDLNKEDGGTRKFIGVQLPEPTDEKSEAYKAGYATIAEVSKERIRKVINKIENEEINKIKIAEAKKQATNQEELAFAEPKEEYKIEKKQQDLGFKVFKLQKSNFKIWDANIIKEPEYIQQALFEHIDHISPEAAQEAILYELLLKSGFSLATPIETITFADKNVYSIADGELLICLEKELTNEVITAMAEKQPSRVICLDEGFQDNDQLKTNAVKIMASKGVVNFRTV